MTKESLSLNAGHRTAEIYLNAVQSQRTELQRLSVPWGRPCLIFTELPIANL